MLIPLHRIYLTIFLMWGIPFGLFFWALDPDWHWQKAAVIGLFYGTGMTLYEIWRTSKDLKILGIAKPSAQEAAQAQRISIHSQMNLSDISQALEQSEISDRISVTNMTNELKVKYHHDTQSASHFIRIKKDENHSDVFHIQNWYTSIFGANLMAFYHNAFLNRKIKDIIMARNARKTSVLKAMEE